jgi:transglutaminase-like putative cysteine protease/tetratricopeptide (TPR) repeat protein
MRFDIALLCGAAFVLAPGTALAADKVLTGAAPGWVSPASLDGIDVKRGPAELIADYQHRLEDGVVHSYYDTAVRIDNSQALMEHNTVSIGWLPDKGDLTVHRLEIYRDGKTIDVLADGAEFDVIRREQGLESRLLDGELTATLSIPGLRVGDVLRTTYSFSLDDQALGDEAQVLQYLGSKPWRVGMGRAIVSWPEDEQMYWRAERDAVPADAELRDGYRYLTMTLPLAEPDDMPQDAPSRYFRPTVLRVGSFTDWTELSRVMAPHFSAAAETAAGDPVAEQAAAIMRDASDPLERAALATRLVQDKISYLLNGLDGGNYLPQKAAFTWDKRYGDCKAKSVLLLALLQRMGIEAEPVLVTTLGGDALPELLPLPGDFDHVIVRATIAGVDYWLDGTSAGTRLANIGNVPPFHYALALRAGGAELIPMTQRERAVPDMQMTFAIDHSAGVDLPQLFSVTMDVSGPGGAMAEAMADADDPDQLRRIAGSVAGSTGFENGVLTSIKVSYDKERAVGRIAIEGIGPPSFTWQEGKLVVDTGGKEGFAFNPNRSRREWRDIPVATPGPSYALTDVSMILPERGRGFSLIGPERFEAGFANTRLVITTSLSGERLNSHAEHRQALGEIAPGEISEARRQALRIEADAPELVAPADVRWRWDLDEAERRGRAAPILAAFGKAADLAMEDDFSPLIQRALFLQNIYEHEAALAAYSELVEKSPSAWAHLQRATVLLELGRRTDALADLQASYDLEPHNSTAISLAREMAYAGKTDEALALLEGLPIGEDEEIDYADARAHISGLLGDTGSALSLLADEVAGKPENSEVLNADCWFRGLFNVALDTAVGSCTRAVERADEPMAALDSRAMVQFRLGNYDAAISDLDAALRLEPGIAASRYLRGVVRLKKGDRAGREDIETALRMSPNLAEFYGRHGVSPAS